MKFWLLNVLALAFAASAQAAAPAENADTAMFPRPARLAPAVAFWTDVFARYSSQQLLLHSVDHPHKILSILDFRADAMRMDPVELRRHMRREERAEKQRLDELLKTVHEFRAQPEKLNAEGLRLHALLADVGGDTRYLDHVGRVRGQFGLHEKTRTALVRAGSYLPYMEKTFSDYGLPIALTRLPIVESSFNVEAYSKVGAAGLWQFIPSTARRYLQMDDVVDTRRDPWQSTDAAARHLRDDYAALGDWALAVTAYNFGRSGVARALKSVQGDSLTDLLERYEAPRFGFASRNFYAEFLAAVDIERHAEQHFPELVRETGLDVETVRVDAYVPFKTLHRISGVDHELFRSLNPAFQAPVLDGKLHVSPDHVLRLPSDRAAPFRAAYASLAQHERFDRQLEYWRLHKVRAGDNLQSIAAKYRSSSRAIARANNLKNMHLIRIGQKLKIPPAADSGSSRKPAVVTHQVRSGQSLWTIARNYKVSLSALRQANGLESSSLIRPGTRLQIPN